MFRRWSLSVVLLATCLTVSPPRVRAESADSTSTIRGLADTPFPDVWPYFSFGLRYTRPQKAAVSISVMRARNNGATNTLFAQLEPGLGGGEFSVGYAGLATDKLQFSPPVFGIAAKATVLRTWGAPLGFDPNRTYVGYQIDLVILFLKFSTGDFWLQGNDVTGKRKLYTWGVGFGF